MVQGVKTGGLLDIARPLQKEKKRPSGKPVERKAETPDIPSYSPHAPLNVVPDNTMIFRMVSLGKKALQMGRFWDRGAIVNLLL